MTITIYHNPRCSKSRSTLELIEAAGVRPAIVRYLDTPPSPERILSIADALGLPVADLVRRNESEFTDADDVPGLDDAAALAQWLYRHPRALQRPIVVDEDQKKAVIGRPPDNVRTLLPG